MLKINLLN